MSRPGASEASPADRAASLPPACDTGVEITAGNHWLRGTTVLELDSVLSWLSTALDESVLVLDRGHHGYRDAYMVGGVKVYDHPEQPQMGRCIDVDGSTCEALGLSMVASIYFGCALRASRLDQMFDHCPFTPAELRHHWQADNVRTRCKVPKDARPDRQWRSCKWHESPSGDTFSMGSRSSTQYARCYDSRGHTRLELELSGEPADLAAQRLFALVEDPAAYALEALSWVRRFVDFVDQESSPNPSRRELLTFWGAFVEGARKARVQLAGTVRRTVEQVRDWFEHQIAPAYALLERALGRSALQEIARAGRRRWSSRHLETLSAAGLSP